MLFEEYVQIIPVFYLKLPRLFCGKVFPLKHLCTVLQKGFSTKRLYTVWWVFYGKVWKSFFHETFIKRLVGVLWTSWKSCFHETSIKRLVGVLWTSFSRVDVFWYIPPPELNNKNLNSIVIFFQRYSIQCNHTCLNVGLIDVTPSLRTALSMMPFKQSLLLSLGPPIPR